MANVANKKALLAHPNLPGLVVVLAPERIRRTRAIDALLAQYKIALKPQRLRAAELTPQGWIRFAQELATPSLFSPQQIFLIDQAHEIPAAQLEQLVKYCKELPPYSHLIISAPKLARANGLMKLAIKAESLLEFDGLKGADLKKWAARECMRVGLKPENDLALEGLVRAAEESPDTLIALLDQLANYLESPTFSLKQLGSIFPERIDQNDFELLDALLDGNPARVLQLVKRLELAGKNPFMLIGMLTRSYANYTRAAGLNARGMSAQAIQSHCGWTPWIGNKTIAAAKKFKTADLIKRLGAIVSADSRLKNRSLGDFAVIDELTLVLQRTPRS